MRQELQENPKEFWKDLGSQPNWIEYILPKRSDEEFWNEGKLEAENIQKIAGDIDTKCVIDYGCGIGRVMKYFPIVERIIGLDVCDKFLGKALGEVYMIDKFEEKEIATFVYCISVIQHNTEKNRKKIVDDIYSLLETGGKAFINFPVTGEVYRKSWFVNTFEEKEIKKLMSKFSKVELINGNLAKYGGFGKLKNHNEIFAIATK